LHRRFPAAQLSSHPGLEKSKAWGTHLIDASPVPMHLIDTAGVAPRSGLVAFFASFTGTSILAEFGREGVWLFNLAWCYWLTLAKGLVGGDFFLRANQPSCKLQQNEVSCPTYMIHLGRAEVSVDSRSSHSLQTTQANQINRRVWISPSHETNFVHQQSLLSEIGANVAARLKHICLKLMIWIRLRRSLSHFAHA
jgi:hypothetical protein